jgi:hypothetical protein
VSSQARQIGSICLAPASALLAIACHQSSRSDASSHPAASSAIAARRVLPTTTQSRTLATRTLNPTTTASNNGLMHTQDAPRSSLQNRLPRSKTSGAVVEAGRMA